MKFLCKIFEHKWKEVKMGMENVHVTSSTHGELSSEVVSLINPKVCLRCDIGTDALLRFNLKGTQYEGAGDVTINKLVADYSIEKPYRLVGKK